jgi:hypothetical protein
MTFFFRKHSTLILFCTLLSLLVLAWLFPAAGLKLGIVFLLFSLVAASLAILAKQKEAYRAGRIRRAVFIRNAVLEILGILLAMGLAGYLGRALAVLATQNIEHALVKVIAGILVGLLAGMGTGSLVRGAWARLVKVSA